MIFVNIVRLLGVNKFHVQYVVSFPSLVPRPIYHER